MSLTEGPYRPAGVVDVKQKPIDFIWLSEYKGIKVNYISKLIPVSDDGYIIVCTDGSGMSCNKVQAQMVLEVLR